MKHKEWCWKSECIPTQLERALIVRKCNEEYEKKNENGRKSEKRRKKSECLYFQKCTVNKIKKVENDMRNR